MTEFVTFYQCAHGRLQFCVHSKFVSRSVNSDGANPEVDSNVGPIRNLPLHGSYLPKWHPAVGSHAALAHTEEIPS